MSAGEGMIRRPAGRIDTLRFEQTQRVNELVHIAVQLQGALERLLEPVAVLQGLDQDDVVSFNVRFAEVELGRRALDLAAELVQDWSKLGPAG